MQLLNRIKIWGKGLLCLLFSYRFSVFSFRIQVFQLSVFRFNTDELKTGKLYADNRKQRTDYWNVCRLALVTAVSLTSIFILLIHPSFAATGINHTINFQGKLVNSDGTNVADSAYSIVFSLYTVSSGGSNVWTETDSVTTKDGVFRVALGVGTSFSSAGIDFNSDTYYLGIKVGSDAEMTPRVQFAAVPYAFNAEKVNGLTVTNNGGNTLNIAANKTLTANNTLILAGTDGKTFTINNSLTFNGTDGNTFTFPNASGSTVCVSGQTCATSGIVGYFQRTTSGGINYLAPAMLADQVSLGVATPTLSNAGLYVESNNFNTKGNALVGINQLGSGPIFTASQSGNTKFVIDNAGNVGVGTTTPSGGHVDIEYTDTSANGLSGIKLANTSSGGGSWYWRVGATGTNTPAGGLSLANDTNYFFTITSSGKFGLGPFNTNPLASLDVQANTGTQPVASFSGQTSFAGLIVDNSGVGDLFTASTSGKTRFTVNNVGVISTASVGTNSMRTATGSSTSGNNAQQTVTMNDYSFFPSISCNAATTGNLQAAEQADPGNTVGLFRVNACSTAGVKSIVYWRYITASDHPTIWMIVNSDGSIAGPTWEAEDPVSQTNYPDNPNPLAANTLQQGQYFASPKPPDINQLRVLYGALPDADRGSILAGLREYIVDQRHWLETVSTVADLANISGRYQSAAREWALRYVAQQYHVSPSQAIQLFFHIANGELVTNSNPYASIQIYQQQLQQIKAAQTGTISHADLAEWYQSNGQATPGDIVSISSNGLLVQTTKVYDQHIAGIVSTSPNTVMGNQVANSDIQLALSGRVPVNVSTENGTIQPGDYLTSSNIPGVAMKATKAGKIIGQALEAYMGSGIGKILVLVQNTEFGGIYESSSGLSSTGNVNIHDLIEMKESISTDSAQQSQIYTDKVIAGLEVVSPTITADTIFAHVIKADHIDGLDAVTNKVAQLDTRVASLSASQSTEVFSASASAEGLETYNNATVSGDLRVKGSGLFEGVLSIIDALKANTFIATGLSEFFNSVIFHQDVTFEGIPTFNQDTAGFAVIKKGSDHVDVVFANSYNQTPITNASLTAANVSVTPTAHQSNLEQQILSEGYTYIITNQSTKGFTILLNKPANEGVQFSWSAIAVKDPKTFQGTVTDATSIATQSAHTGQ